MFGRNLNYMTKQLLGVIFILTLFSSCKKKTPQPTKTEDRFVAIPLKYAKGFGLFKNADITRIDVYNPWPNATDTLRLFFAPGKTLKKTSKTIQTPIKRLIACSTTDIPLLEALGEVSKLVGFPETDYISSKKTRALIDQNSVREIGSLMHLNTETVLDLSPDLLIGFSSQKENKSFQLLERSGIPILMNGSWLENHPLGRAEWIKIYGVLFHKEKEAEAEFNTIEKKYLELKQLSLQATNIPSVISGNMYKDVWYMPAGESYAAQLMQDANTNYLWKDSKGTGSLSLSFESVLDKGQQAEYWIGGGSFESIATLTDFEEKYNLFEATKQHNVFSKDLKKGAKKGILYYEQGALRADWILADLISIFHPELLPNHQFHFYQKLN